MALAHQHVELLGTEGHHLYILLGNGQHGEAGIEGAGAQAVDQPLLGHIRVAQLDRGIASAEGLQHGQHHAEQIGLESEV